MDHKPICTVPDYYPEQLELEHEYYDKLYAILLILITWLITYLENDRVNLTGLLAVYQRFIDNYYYQIVALNREYAVKIYNLCQKTCSTGQFAPYGTVDSLAKDMNLKTDNLLDTIKGRFITLFPAGYVGPGQTLYTNETTKDDLIRRSNKSISLFVQELITAAVVFMLIFNFEYNGYTEYQAGNREDDKVRAEHRKYNDFKRWNSLTNPPPCGVPGFEPNCRCFFIFFR